MATTYNPRVVTDGLILYYDMGNTRKSWLGKPTTNIGANVGILNVQANPVITYVGLEDGWKKYSLNGTWASGTYPYSIALNVVPLTGNVTYSSSVQVKTNVPQKFETFATGMNYVNAPQNLAGTSFYTPQSDGSIIVGRYGFQYVSSSSQSGYLLSKPLADGTTFNSATDFVWVKNEQIEEGTFNTPYTPGTRSASNSIISMVGSNPITISSLTYASDNTFSFDGAGNYLNLGSSIQMINNFTCSFWHKNLNTGFLLDQGDIGLDLTGCLEVTNYGLTVSYNNIEGVTADGAPTFPAANWNNVVLTFSSGVVNFYINGKLDSIKTMPTITTFSPGGSILKIGRRAFNTTAALSGQLSNVSIYNRVLTAAEVAQNFNALRGRFGI